MKNELPDLTPFFARYEQIAGEADAVFEHIRSRYPEEVICKEQCASCCHALFDLSLVEALYLNAKFNEKFSSGLERFKLLDLADEADRKTVKIKRKAFQDSKEGKDSNEILSWISGIQVRCPLLGEDDRCVLYEYRPVTCRLYGVPTAIGGRAHTCGKTGFARGQSYPTVALDKMQARLTTLSEELAASINTAYTELASMYVPVSMAMLTEYTPAYLGIGGISKEKD